MASRCFRKKVRKRLKGKEIAFRSRQRAQKSAQVVENKGRVSGVESTGCALFVREANKGLTGMVCLQEGNGEVGPDALGRE